MRCRSTTDSSCFMGTKGLSSTPWHRFHAALPMRPNWSTIFSNAIAATSTHGVQSEAVYGNLHRGVDGEEVDRVGRKEGGGIGGNPGRSKRRTGHGRNEGGELGVGHSHP